MRELEKYRSPITVAKNVLDSAVEAYKMDSTDTSRHMRMDVGLGTCECCDFFHIFNEEILLIEETSLFDSYYDQIKQFGEIESFYAESLKENRLKAYGSMLVLCRLATNLKCVKKLSQGKRYTFVLLVSSIVPDIEKRKFEYLSARIHNDLKSVLS